MHPAFLDLIADANVLSIQEIGHHGQRIHSERANMMTYLDTKIDRTGYVTNTYSITNRLGTYVRTESVPFVSDVTPARGDDELHHNSTWTRITRCKGKRPIFLANLYAAGPSSSEYILGREQMAENWDSLQKECIDFMKLGDIVIATDANARTNTLTDGRNTQRHNEDPAPVDANGVCLLDLCVTLGLRIVGEGVNTRDDPAGRPSSTIDYFLVSECLLERCKLTIHSINTPTLHLSDHKVLKLVIEDGLPVLQNSRKKVSQTQRRRQAEAHLISMKSEIRLQRRQLLAERIESTPQYLYGRLQQIATNLSSTAEPEAGSEEDSTFYDQELRNMSREVKDITARYRGSTNAIEKAELRKAKTEKKAQFRRLRRVKVAEYNEKLRATYKELIESGNIAVVRDLVHAPSSRDSRLADLPFIETPEQKERMRKHIRSLLQEAALPTPNCAFEVRSSSANRVVPPSDEEIMDVIESLKASAMPGADKISPRMWTLFHQEIPEVVNNMIRQVWANPALMPTEWNFYKISLIPKSEEAVYNPSHVRTISISQIITKIVSGLITNRLTPFAVEQGMLPDEQFGFRAGRSTSDAYFVLRTKILTRIAEGK